MSRQEKDLALQALRESAKCFSGTQPVQKFIDELLTESEKITIGRRILMAQMIMSGYTRSEIQYKLGVSPNTFTRTKEWLEGRIPQYDQALKEADADLAKRQAASKKSSPGRPRKTYHDPTTFKGLRERYPMHFLLFNAAEAIIEKIVK